MTTVSDNSPSIAPDPVIRETFDQYAAEYDQKFNQNPVAIYQRDQVHQLLTPYLQKAHRVLDIGCGPGSDFEFYQRFNIDMYAIDLSVGMIEQARKKACALGLEITLQATPLEDFQTEYLFDLVVLNFGVINAMPDVRAALAKIDTLLTSGGKILIVSMPPVHVMGLMGSLVRCQFGTLYQRVVKKRAVLPNGFVIRYYRQPDFCCGSFKLIRRLPLCPLLPHPDQYIAREFWRTVFHGLKLIDHKIGAIWPDLLGGDHVCYVLCRTIR